MIMLLIDALLPLTILLVLILIFHRLVSTYLGVRVNYALWLLVPLGVACYFLPVPWQAVNDVTLPQISRYLVNPSQQLFKENSIDFTTLWFIGLWFIGTGVLIILWFMSHINFADKLQLTKVARQKLPLAQTKKIEIYQSNYAYSPMLIGFFKQKLVIPTNFFEFYSQDQQALILAHEICHFDRNDIYWNFLALCCVALFWFHPLVWLAYFRFRQDQELSCDQTVLARKQIQSRINYSKALLVAAEHAPPLAFAQLSFKKYGDKYLMFERIKQIKINQQATKLSLVIVMASSVTLLSGLSYAGSLTNHTSEADSKVQKLAESKTKIITPIMRVEPKYPVKAAQENIEGSVVLQFDIATNGSVQNVEVVKGEPAYIFDHVAVTALKQWQYNTLNEVAKNNLVQLDFRID